MAQKVFKIPDGNGGITYQIQTPDGKWHITDKNGVPLPEDKREEEPRATAPQKIPEKPKAGRSRKKVSPSDGLPYVQFSMKIPKEEYKVLSSYVYWWNLSKGALSRSEFLLQAGLEAVRKNKEYKEFLRKNPDITG